MDRIEKDWTELDFDAVDFDSGNWTWGRGGKPHDDWEFSIIHVSDIEEGLIETRYKLPSVISQMLRAQLQHGKDDARNKIRSALGVC